MNEVVIDASVTVKWFINDTALEPDQEKALALLRAIIEGHLSPHQPSHWFAEVAAVLARTTPAAYAEESILLLDALELPIEDNMNIIQRAVRLAAELDHHLFDTLYHAVALATGGVFITADERYYRKAQTLGHILRLVDWRAPAA